MDESLFEKLQRLGVQFSARNIPAPQERISESHPIDQVMRGYFHENTFGQAFVYEEKFSVDYQHGRVAFDEPIDYGSLSEWARVPSFTGANLQDLLFLDTETSGLAGGTGTFAFMVGLGYFEETGFTLKQLYLRTPGEESALLAALEEIASHFSVVVTYNGKSFDIPLLNTRYTLNAFQSPFGNIGHIDLLNLTRRIWKNRLSSRTLGNIELEILDVHRSQEEIPGWMIPDMYYEYLKTGDARPMAGVFYHNKIDILSLAALLVYAGRLLSEPMNYCQDQALDLISIARIFEDLGRVEEAASFYENSLSAGLPRPFFIQTLYRYADLSRKKSNWPAAIDLWQKAAGYGEYEAAICLAKYYEHQSRDVSLAITWTEQALVLLEEVPYPIYIRKQKQTEVLHRLDRLKQKITKGTPKNGTDHE